MAIAGIVVLRLMCESLSSHTQKLHLPDCWLDKHIRPTHSGDDGRIDRASGGVYNQLGGSCDDAAFVAVGTDAQYVY